MKQSNMLAAGAAALVALAAVSGIAFSALAQDNISQHPRWEKLKQRHAHFMGLSEEEKAELKAGWEARRAEMEERREAVRAALEAGDYQAWVEAHKGDEPILERINEDNFGLLTEAHEHMEAAREIFGELGIERGPGKGFGPGRGMPWK